MGCCTPARRSVVIEVTVLRVEGETCERCNGTVDAVRDAAGQLEKALAPLGVDVSLVEHAATMDNLVDSNSVVVNGKPIEEWIGAERVSTECVSCGDLCGESVGCGAVAVGDTVQESYTVEQVRDAVFAAMSAQPAGGCCG